MGDHESDGLEYQDDEEEDDEDDEPVYDLTGGGALLSVWRLPLQPPGCTTLRASVRFACPEARRPTLGRSYYASHGPRAGFDAFL